MGVKCRLDCAHRRQFCRIAIAFQLADFGPSDPMFGAETAAARRGHVVECCQANGGGYQAIMRDFETGVWIAATEMRKDGNADGY